MKRSREDDNVDLLHLPHTKRMREEHSLSSKGCSWLRGPMIGKGGFGSVFLAYNNNPTSRFKDFPPVMAVKSVEASSCSELVKEKILLDIVKDCPFIIQSYGEDVTVGYKGKIIINLFLEYASEGSLMDLIEKSEGSGLVESQVKGTTESILKGIKRIHEAGYVHCDLKPQNILLVPQENSSASASPFVAKIADFGLAKAAQGFTRRSQVKGTLMYLSPEAVNFGIQDQPSDIWALGCIVLYMLTGRNPWALKSGEGNHELKERISEDSPEIPNGLSKKAKDFLKQCFTRSPSDRPTADMLLSHPFVCSGFGKGDNNDDDKEELLSVHSVQASSLPLSEPDDEFRASFIALVSSSFGETEEVQGNITGAISDKPYKPSVFAVCSAA